MMDFRQYAVYPGQGRQPTPYFAPQLHIETTDTAAHRQSTGQASESVRFRNVSHCPNVNHAALSFSDVPDPQLPTGGSAKCLVPPQYSANAIPAWYEYQCVEEGRPGSCIQYGVCHHFSHSGDASNEQSARVAPYTPDPYAGHTLGPPLTRHEAVQKPRRSRHPAVPGINRSVPLSDQGIPTIMLSYEDAFDMCLDGTGATGSSLSNGPIITPQQLRGSQVIDQNTRKIWGHHPTSPRQALGLSMYDACYSTPPG